MILTTEQIIQWGIIFLTGAIFLVRQSRMSGQNQQKLDDLETQLSQRVDKLEVKAFGNGGSGFVTQARYDKNEKDCRGNLQAMINTNAGLISRLVDRLDRMDERREARMVIENNRTSDIESSIAGLSSDIKHLTALLENKA